MENMEGNRMLFESFFPNLFIGRLGPSMDSDACVGWIASMWNEEYDDGPTVAPYEYIVVNQKGLWIYNPDRGVY